MRYYAFGFDARALGGLLDQIGVYDTLSEAKSAIETEAPHHAYWHEYNGHIAVFNGNDLKIILHYAAVLEGNLYGGKVTEQVWSESDVETQALLSGIP